jgi:bifunctional enzyme CysN/CysC
MSALRGDNITEPSAHSPWYAGPPLMSLLETLEVGDALQADPFRLPVQWVNRPNLDFRGFSGQIAAGTVRPGDPVRVLPSGKHLDRGPHRHRRRRLEAWPWPDSRSP